MEVLDRKIDFSIISKLNIPGNDFRSDLLAWLNERIMDKGTFLKLYPKENIIDEGEHSIVYKTGKQTARISGKLPEVKEYKNESSISQFSPAKTIQKKMKNAIQMKLKSYEEIIIDLNRYRNETKIMENLQGSKYIVKLFDTILVGFGVCHIMEYADAGSLEKFIPESGMSVEEALACMYQLFQGLVFVHSNNFIHYDIKPSNVLVFSNGRLKLTDFDMSLRQQNETIIDNFGNPFTKFQLAGTPFVMAPEIFKLQTVHPSHIYKVDIFAAGRSFLLLLTNDDFFYEDPLTILRKTENADNIENALLIEKNVKGNTCNRCASLFKYTLKSLPSERKSSTYILQKMERWTRRPRKYGFHENKSMRIVKDMVTRHNEIIPNMANQPVFGIQLRF